MAGIEQALQAILMSTHYGVATWIYTTLLFLVVMPSILGMILGIAGMKVKELSFDTLIKFWFKYCLLGVVLIPFKLIQYAIKTYKKSKQEREKEQRRQERERQRQQAQGGHP